MLDISNQTALEAIEAAIKIKSYKRDKGPEIENVLKIGKLMSDLAKVTPSKKVLGLGLKKNILRSRKYLPALEATVGGSMKPFQASEILTSWTSWGSLRSKILSRETLR